MKRGIRIRRGQESEVRDGEINRRGDFTMRILICAMILGLSVTAANSTEIVVGRTKGDVTVRSGVQETWHPVKPGDKLKPGDSMKTGRGASAVLLVVMDDSKSQEKISIPADVILDLSDIRKLTRDELILKLTMERVNTSSYEWKNSELQIPNATVVHGQQPKQDAMQDADEQAAVLRMNGTKVLFKNGYFSTCALRGLSLLGRFPSLGESFENRYMVAESLERSDLRGEALNEYIALSSMDGLTADQQRLVRSSITRLRGEG